MNRSRATRKLCTPGRVDAPIKMIPAGLQATGSKFGLCHSGLEAPTAVASQRRFVNLVHDSSEPIRKP
jgi:hypothetical protein